MTGTDAGRRPSAAERDAWLTLAAVDGVGSETFATLVATFGGAAAVLDAARTGRLSRGPIAARSRTADGHAPRSLPSRLAEAIERAARDPGAAACDIDAAGVWTLTPLDVGYPARLHDLDPPPAVIYGWGDPAALRAERSIAVVGTRRPTPTGRDLAARVASRLVACHAAVVSGLAIGIDGAAHAAAVDAAGITVAVIGAGHGHPGPRAHAALRAAILATGGAVVSELPPHAHPTRGTFPRRNRIIAAVSDATVVVEAPRRSGALITARHALELGRTVLAAPGRPLDAAVAGCLELLRETPARPLTGLDELVSDLGLHERPAAAERSRPLSLAAALALLGPAERAVAERLCRGPSSADELVAASRLPPATVSGALTLLMLRGWARPLGAAYLAGGPLVRGETP